MRKLRSLYELQVKELLSFTLNDIDVDETIKSLIFKLKPKLLKNIPQTNNFLKGKIFKVSIQFYDDTNVITSSFFTNENYVKVKCSFMVGDVIVDGFSGMPLSNLSEDYRDMLGFIFIEYVGENNKNVQLFS